MNQHMKMILTQVEDFLSHTSSVEEIQVIRKLNSLTLLADEKINKASALIIEESIPDDRELLADQCDFTDDENHNNLDDDISEKVQDYEEPVEEIEFQENKDVNMMFVEASYCPCVKCGELLKSNDELEIHEFFKHSLIGIRIEDEMELIVETENSSTIIIKCGLCDVSFGNSSSATALHILNDHVLELLTIVNETFNISPNANDSENVHKFISHVKNLMQSNFSEIYSETKEKFFEHYACDSMKTEIVDPEPFVESDGDIASFSHIYDDDKTPSDVDSKEKKIRKTTANLTEDNRAWIRKEISLRKVAIPNENGKKRFIYQCVYCNKFSSNSAPGFRYHLVSKHLGENNPEELQEVKPLFDLPPSAIKIEKNTCFECNLKFKDQKLLRSHMNCHDLFAVIAQDYTFPSCNTCSKFFIDEPTLEKHLAVHSSNEDVTQPIEVKSGALLVQGKFLAELNNDGTGEIPDIEFSWKCGHCSKRFHREEVCRFHLLMFHAPHFVCPIEKREFHGFKAVSLFAHHLKNKHSHLFPEITFPCTFCKLEFSSIYDKLSHMKSCNLKKFSCDHCGKKFFRKGDLVAHLKFVSGELFYPCRVCYKRCETMSDLKIHLRSHTKEVS